MSEPSSARQPGETVLGRYRLERFLGRGAFGEVWAGRHLTLGRVDALKFASEGKRGQLEDEARILAGLRHPNIVLVYDIDLSNAEPTLVMEYIEGESLRERLTRESQLPVEDAVAIGVAVLNALEHAHAKGILHRDVKPENVLLGADGIVRLGDFGLGKMTDTEVSMLSMRSASGWEHGPSVTGTLRYMAPEQEQGHEEERSDVYAVGVLLYEMLTGRVPRGRFKEPAAWNPSVGRGLSDAILRALQEDVEDRFSSAAAMGEALQAPRPAGPARVRDQEPQAPAPPRAAPQQPCVDLPAGLTADLTRAAHRFPADLVPEGSVVNGWDGTILVPIPAGEAIFGSPDADRDARAYEKPQFRASLPSYYTGLCPVTNAQFSRFVDVCRHRPPTHWLDARVPPGLESHPVVNVDWDDAAAYCEWAGLRLPSELEWEKAARGTDGRTYPWGCAWEASRCRNAEIRGHEQTAPIDAYPLGRSPYGLFDMTGNAWEWCEDWYETRAYERYSHGNMTPPTERPARVVRGGSWRGSARQCRASHRTDALSPTCRAADVGFRAARDFEA